jgi:phosphoribosylanthranilate isomerase
MSVIVKICGLSTEETLDAALDAGADRIGLVFFPRSPRFVDLDRAKALAERARGRAAIVALVVDAPDSMLISIVETLAPDWLQLHGKEGLLRVEEIQQRFGRKVSKAIGIRTADDLAAVAAYARLANEVLLDAKPPKGAVLPGGNGVTFDWHLLDALDPGLPYMLSGGLDPDNVAAAIAATGARAVDVSSGVESAPGIKDPDRIRAFIAAARGSMDQSRLSGERMAS